MTNTTKAIVLNHSAMSMKLRSIFNANKDMKAVSKMLTQEFTLAKTPDPAVMHLVMKNGEVQVANIIDNRFVVISYAKPKGAKNDTIFLNKNVSITSNSASKVVVVDLQERTVENGDSFSGFTISSEESNPVKFALATALSIVAVRNYINHTQLYVVSFGEEVLIADNIKAVRATIKQELDKVSEVFSADNSQKFAQDMEAALGVTA